MKLGRFLVRWRDRSKSWLWSGGAFLVAISASSSAFAQCNSVNSATGIGALFAPSTSGYQASTAASAGAIAGAIGNLSTVFQAQQGSAFVSAPSDPKADQPGGGVWTRAVGGESTDKFSNSSTSNIGVPPVFLGGGSLSQTSNCSGSVHESFAGMQVGQDISRLNWGGWNLHIGVTAGYLATHSFASNGSSFDLEAPFFGGYLVATHGRFFADVLVRDEVYNGRSTDFAFGTYNQQIGGNGISVATSAGYNFELPNNWFIEPSGGFIWSRANFDNFNVANPPLIIGGAGFLPGAFLTTVQNAPIYSEIGRLSLRAGTTVTYGNWILQPFVSASVYSEFAGNITTSLTSGGPTVFTLGGTSSTSRIGTYGQYSLGLAAQLANTGWLGFVRGDYRKGDDIEGWTANAGLRYQFSPEAIASFIPLPTKAPAINKAIGGTGPATNWTGVYAGGFAGMAFGKTDAQFIGDPNNDSNNQHVGGFLGGAQLGYNYQTASNWVVGLEGDLGETNLKGAATCGLGGRPGGSPTGGFNPDAMTCATATNWMATAAARLGYAWDRTLLFVKAGGALMDESETASCNFGPNNGFFTDAFSTCVNQAGAATNGFGTSGHRSGWLVGTGFEFDLGHHWSAKAEYDYIDFGTRTALASDGTTILRDSGAINQVKIGVNYHFWSQALVARY